MSFPNSSSFSSQRVEYLPESVEGQRRARLVTAIVALTAIIAGQLLSGGKGTDAFVAAGSIAAIWILAFSLVDLSKEFPTVQWQSVAASAFAIGGLPMAMAQMLVSGGLT
jgi:hypothetical protein